MNAPLPVFRYFEKSIKTIRFLFLVLIFFKTPAIQAQELSKDSLKEEYNSLSQKPFKTVSFGDKINFGKIENSIFWTISNMDSNNKSSLIGNEINNYIFETPGTYKITFHENKAIIEGECNHGLFPELMIIKVSPYKMDFDFSTIQFSKKLEAEVSSENYELTIEVHLKSFSNDKVKFQNGKIVSAGIDTTIEGQLSNNTVTLLPGINRLVYQLKGTAKAETFIMLDFFDINGQVQSFYYPTKL